MDSEQKTTEIPETTGSLQEHPSAAFGSSRANGGSDMQTHVESVQEMQQVVEDYSPIICDDVKSENHVPEMSSGVFEPVDAPLESIKVTGTEHCDADEVVQNIDGNEESQVEVEKLLLSILERITYNEGSQELEHNVPKPLEEPSNEKTSSTSSFKSILENDVIKKLRRFGVGSDRTQESKTFKLRVSDLMSKRGIFDYGPDGKRSFWILETTKSTDTPDMHGVLRTTKKPSLQGKYKRSARVPFDTSRPCGGTSTLTKPQQRGVSFGKWELPSRQHKSAFLRGRDDKFYKGVMGTEAEPAKPELNKLLDTEMEDLISSASDDFLTDTNSPEWDEILDIDKIIEQVAPSMNVSVPRHCGGQSTKTAPQQRGIKFVRVRIPIHRARNNLKEQMEKESLRSVNGKVVGESHVKNSNKELKYEDLLSVRRIC